MWQFRALVVCSAEDLKLVFAGNKTWESSVISKLHLSWYYTNKLNTSLTLKCIRNEHPDSVHNALTVTIHQNIVSCPSCSVNTWLSFSQKQEYLCQGQSLVSSTTRCCWPLKITKTSEKCTSCALYLNLLKSYNVLCEEQTDPEFVIHWQYDSYCIFTNKYINT